MSNYPPEQYESEYLHTAILEYQRDVERLTVELSAAQARIAELEGELAAIRPLALQCAEWHLGDTDECGEVARKLHSLLEG